MRKHNIYQILLTLTLSFSIIFSGCAHSRKTSENISTPQITTSQEATTEENSTEPATTEANVDINSPEVIEEQNAFDEFTDEMFRDEVSANIINLHYNLANPEDYGITEYEIVLGDYSEEGIEDYNKDIEKYLKELAAFDYDKLTH